MPRLLCPRRHLRQRGWTLLEILVVIFVIAVLAALALPVFAKARQRAIQAVCQNHLKQMGMATRLYLQYNDNFYFPYDVEIDEHTTLYYYGLEREIPGTDRVELDVTRGYLFPYYSVVSGVERCPAFNPHSAPGEKLRGATLGYGYNRWGVAGRSAGSITTPESIVLFADCAHVACRRDKGQLALTVEEWRFVSPSDFTVHFRHGDQANVLFCDGHVEARRPKSVLSVLPDARLGMLNELGDTSLFIP